METGFILIDKNPGFTSHDIVNILRKITKIKKIGHAGTLDPIASGLLIVGIGRESTKKLENFQKLDKEYLVKIKLGAISDTFDKEGKIKKIKVDKIPSLEKIKEIIKEFIGEIQQIPPQFSAKKIKGKKAYELARKGIKVRLKPSKVKIYNIEILNYSFPFLELKINCSSGTYIRSLANDIGKKLKCGGYVEELRRTKIGEFSVEKAIKVEKLNSQNWKNFLFKW